MTRNRAVSTSLSYIYTLAITTILISGLIVAMGSYVEDQRDRVVEGELEVIGEQVARQIVEADSIVRATDGAATVRIRPDVPAEAVGRTYTVEVADLGSDRYELYLRSENGNVNVTVSFTVRTDVAETSANSGNLLIEYTGGSIEVTNG